MKKTAKMFLIFLALLTITITGAVAQTNLEQSEAENLALKTAGISRGEATLLNTQLEKEDGREIYDIEFYANGVEFELHLDAEDGTILKHKWEADDAKMTELAKSQNADSEWIGEARALDIALADASLSAADVTVTESKFGEEDLLRIYEISFYTAQAEYEYEIEAANGEICARSVKYAIANAAEEQTPDDIQNGESDSSIGVDRAKDIALNHAGLSDSDVNFTKAKLEKEDGQRIYEVEFRAGDMEYEYEIDAESGDILEYDKEYDD